jgi:hypothetical protein
VRSLSARASSMNTLTRPVDDSTDSVLCEPAALDLGISVLRLQRKIHYGAMAPFQGINIASLTPGSKKLHDKQHIHTPATMWSHAHPLTSCSNHYERIDRVERQSFDSTLNHSHKSSSWRVPRFLSFTQKTSLLFIADLVLLGIILHILSPLIFLLRHNKELFPAHVSITSSNVPKSFTQQDRQIPWILHQTTKNETIPSIWAKSQASCLRTYSDYEYMVCPGVHLPYHAR